MVEEKYEIWCGNTMLADNMIIDIAIVLLRALFENRYRFEDGLELKIKRKKVVEVEE